jgi:uncharacterized protein (DUF1800 family)
MVRSNRPLVERMALVWHDWFATSTVGVKSQQLMLNQNALFRVGGLGSFRDMLINVTKDPATLVWLSGFKNTKRSPNENYARELMELFTLGANRGYTETDVREQARALTGWRAKRSKALGFYDFAYDSRQHDDGTKTIFGKAGNFGWEDACRLCLEHPKHASFFVGKLWSYFIPTPPGPKARAGLEALYRADYQIRPVVEAILMHPDLYNGPRMVKPPAVYTAGLLRAIGRGVDTSLWWRLSGLSGQRLFYPPNVAGWDDSRWLDTSTWRGRWFIAMTALEPYRSISSSTANPKRLVDQAHAFFGGPPLTPETKKVLLAFARAGLPQARSHGNAPAIVEGCLRQLIALSPDYQTS